MSLCGRTLEKAEQIKDAYKEFNKLVEIRLDINANINIYLKSADLIVNATSVGMLPKVKDSLLPNSFSLRKQAIVYDLVYNPLESTLLRHVKKNCPDCITINGLNMLIAQAVKAVEIWTGKTISIENIINALDKSNLLL